MTCTHQLQRGKQSILLKRLQAPLVESCPVLKPFQYAVMQEGQGRRKRGAAAGSQKRRSTLGQRLALLVPVVPGPDCVCAQNTAPLAIETLCLSQWLEPQRASCISLELEPQRA
eukprot:1158762-Pelagomonas_calceolata.AAC.2